MYGLVLHGDAEHRKARILMSRRSLDKGKRGEREAAAEIRRLFGTAAERGRQYHGRDDAPDIVTGISGVHFEVKRVESFHLYGSLGQAAGDAGDNVPVVLHRRNGKPWVAVVRLDDLPQLATRLYWTLTGIQNLQRERTCLKCDKPFLSEGPANRICPRCAAENRRKYGHMPESCIEAQRGRKYRNGEPMALDGGDAF